MHRRAFTLIELLIVVAIIGILAAIAVPNFVNARLKAKIAKVESDFNALATSFRMYTLDNNNRLPKWTSLGFDQAWRRFTSPIAYLTSIPLDEFSVNPGGISDFLDKNPFWYYEYSASLGSLSFNNGKTGGKVDNFVFASYGPDKEDDTDLIQSYPRSSKFLQFDLSNGLRSDGDILYETAPGLNGRL